MISKTTFQNYFSLESNENCVIWGLGNEKRNAIDVLKYWIKKNPSAYYIIIVSEDQKYEVFQELRDSNTNYLFLTVNEHIEFEKESLRQFVDYISSLSNETRITLDVTGIFRENLLIILHLLRTLTQCRIKIVYISCVYGAYNVNNYTPPKNVLFFEGNPVLGCPTVLILLAGYENMACEVLINTYQPNLLYIGFSKKPIEENQNLPELASVNKLTENYIGKVDMAINSFKYTADDFAKTFESLCQLVTENNLDKNFNIILASCTSKLATVGLFLFHERYPKSQFVYTIGNKEDLSNDILNVFEDEMPDLYGKEE